MMENVQEIDGFCPLSLSFLDYKTKRIERYSTSSDQEISLLVHSFTVNERTSKRFQGTQLWQKAGFEWREIYGLASNGPGTQSKNGYKVFCGERFATHGCGLFRIQNILARQQRTRSNDFRAVGRNIIKFYLFYHSGGAQNSVHICRRKQ